MKITAAILSVLLCAQVANATAIGKSHRARRLARRETLVHKSQPYYANKDATVESNWGGAVIEGSSLTAVSATVNVPEGGGGSSAAGTAWVGIDGYTCDSAILQTGFDWYGDGTFDAWYEWYPEVSDDFSGITIAEGDSIAMSVVATSKTSGSATLENLTTGQKVSKTFSGVTAGSLCETNAEWIIEDFEECNSSGNNCQFVPFASFSPAVKFSDASYTKSGKVVNSLSGAIITEVIINNQDKTSCSISGDTLTCSYV